jgi:Domain of unknown function (DUF4352)
MSTHTLPPWQQQPGQPGPGQPYVGYPPPQPPTKKSWFSRHKILTGLGAFAVLVIVLSAVGAGSNTNTEPTGETDAAAVSGGGDQTTAATPKAPAQKATTEKPAPPPAAPKAPGIGKSVRDGKFEFTVSKVQCGVRQVGGEYGVKADGQFCLVTVKVENTGDEAQLLDSSSQFGYDAAGRKLSADGGAGIYANPGGGGAFLNEINPGNAASAVIVFDIPRTAKLVRLELHASPFSGGVEVTLT